MPGHQLNLGRYFTDAVRLADDEPAEGSKTPRYKWVHAATAGQYDGYHGGAFELTRADFETMIANFRGDPKYERGTLSVDGAEVEIGAKPVVQFDYEHASEMAPFEGSIPTSGAPAIAWATELEIRAGADGQAQLWALADLGDQIRGQLDRREYHSLSIAWNPEGVHWQTGEEIGAVLTSIAFTNHPFLRHLESIAATARRAATGRPSRDPLERTHAPEAHGGGGNPERRQMNLRKRLTTILRLADEADDESVAAAVQTAAEGSANLSSLLEMLGVPNGAQAMEVIPALTAAREQLRSLSAELDALLQSDASMDEQVAQTDVSAALSAQHWPQEAAAPVATHRAALIAEEIGKLTADGKSKPSIAQVREARAAGRKRFCEHYGLNAQGAAHLGASLLAGPGGTQLPAPGGARPAGVPPTAMPQPPAGLPAGVPGVQPLPLSDRQPPAAVDLSGYQGNTTQRILAHLDATDPSFPKLTHENRIKRAFAFRSQHGIN